MTFEQCEIKISKYVGKAYSLIHLYMPKLFLKQPGEQTGKRPKYIYMFFIFILEKSRCSRSVKSFYFIEIFYIVLMEIVSVLCHLLHVVYLLNFRNKMFMVGAKT